MKDLKKTVSKRIMIDYKKYTILLNTNSYSIYSYPIRIKKQAKKILFHILN